MDFTSCTVVYLDSRARENRFEESMAHRAPLSSSTTTTTAALEETNLEVHANVRCLLSCFRGVHIVKSGPDCLSKIRELDASAKLCTPILVFVDTAMDVKDDPGIRSQRSSRQPVSPNPSAYDDSEDFYGLAFVKHVASESKKSNLSKLVVLITLVRLTMPVEGSSPLPIEIHSHSRSSSDSFRTIKCLEAGATDVIMSSLHQERVQALTIHAYRAHLDASKEKPQFLSEKRMRKMSWVGMDEEKPYAWLRETMVSELMESICKPKTAVVKPLPPNSYYIHPSREEDIARQMASWAFNTHDFTDDELMHAGFLMLQHALTMPELRKWRLPDEDLRNFLQACRLAYNSFVKYHNFRHVIDVMQAVFFFLLQLGALPPYPLHKTPPSSKPVSPVASLIRPFEAFVLLVAAIGHDVGHPGVNNAFLVALKSPLAQLYNDNSVLEAFHCAAYSQILRRYWNSAFEDVEVRRLLINTILATDMQLHFKYMADAGDLQSRLHHSGDTDSWNDKQIADCRYLACGLLIKCADISNVARPFDIASGWADILQHEFAQQGEMEENVGMETKLFGGPPEIGNLTKLAESQKGFMNIFAGPLFDAVRNIMPTMQFSVDEIDKNRQRWVEKISEEEAKSPGVAKERFASEGMQSPRSGSPDRLYMSSSPEASHPEGLPASGSSPQPPVSPPMHTSPDSPELQQTAHHTRGVGEALSTPDHTAHHSINPSLHLPIHSNNSELVDASRRSSSAIPGANIARGHSSARSSNAPIPTRLDLGPYSSNPATASHENVPLGASPGPTFLDHGSAPSTAPRTRSNSSGNGNGINASPQRNGIDADPSSPPAFAGNFSRPMSARHSTQPSYARSSAPSNTPTFASNVLPTSPAETQATSFLEEGSDLGRNSDAGLAPHDSNLDLDRPSSGYSSGFATATSTISSTGRSPMGRRPGDIGTPPRSAPYGGVAGSLSNGHVDGGSDRAVRKKTSRFRFDFWKKKRPGEVSP